jgi:hypothetical protein
MSLLDPSEEPHFSSQTSRSNSSSVSASKLYPKKSRRGALVDPSTVPSTDRRVPIRNIPDYPHADIDVARPKSPPKNFTNTIEIPEYERYQPDQTSPEDDAHHKADQCGMIKSLFLVLMVPISALMIIIIICLITLNPKNHAPPARKSSPVPQNKANGRGDGPIKPANRATLNHSNDSNSDTDTRHRHHRIKRTPKVPDGSGPSRSSSPPKGRDKHPVGSKRQPIPESKQDRPNTATDGANLSPMKESNGLSTGPKIEKIPHNNSRNRPVEGGR